MTSRSDIVATGDDEVLVFGASSQIGDALLPMLGRTGIGLRAISRNPPANRPGLRWVRGGFDDIGDPPKTVISLGPLADFSRWLGQVGGVHRIIAVGSVSLRHKSDSGAAEERTVAAQLAEAEQLIAERSKQMDAQLTLLRPCMLYGAGRDHTVAPALRFALDRQWLPIPSPAGGLRQPLHVADLADAISQCLNGAGVGQTLELGGAERLRFDQLLSRIAEAVPNCQARRLPISAVRWASAIAAPWSGKLRRINRALNRANVDQLPDETLTRQHLDWRPRQFEPVQPGQTRAGR